MLITKFNQMIRSKVLWGALAFVIAFVFIGASIELGGCSRSHAGAVGTLYGDPVMPQELFRAKVFELGLRRTAATTPEEDALVEQQAWRRLAALKTAERMGIQVSNAELAATIQRDPTFAVNGAFSRQKYESIVRSQLQVDVPLFEEYLRQELLLGKLLRMLEATAWVAPTELERRLSNLTDQFTIHYARVTETNLVETPEVTGEDVSAYFEENRERFAVPPKTRVRYVQFPISNYLEQASVKDFQIEDYYELHSDEFTRPGTNETEEVVPLEEARDEIVSVLRRQEATYLAREDATDFVMRLARDRYGRSMSWAEAAATNNLTTYTTELFAVDEEVPGLEVGPEFNRVAFELAPGNQDENFSDAITGSNYVYVIAAEERMDARIPELEEIAEQVRPLAVSNLQYEAVLERAEQIRNEAADQMAQGETFREVMAEFDLNVSTTRPFSAYEAFSGEIDHAPELLSEVMNSPEGELTEPLAVPGGALIAWVAGREQSNFAAMEMMRPELVSSLTRQQARILYREWTDDLLERAEFEDLRAKAMAAPDRPGLGQE